MYTYDKNMIAIRLVN